MRQIQAQTRFQDVTRHLTSRLSLFSQLPEQVFVESNLSFSCADFYIGMNSAFLKALALSAKKKVVLYIMEPSPERFYRLSGYYPVYEFKEVDKLGGLISQLHRPIQGNPAEAVAVNNWRFAYLSDKPRWTVLCDRYFEVCILSSNDKEILLELCANIKKTAAGECGTFNEYFNAEDYEGYDKTLLRQLFRNFGEAIPGWLGPEQTGKPG